MANFSASVFFTPLRSMSPRLHDSVMALRDDRAATFAIFLPVDPAVFLHLFHQAFEPFEADGVSFVDDFGKRTLNGITQGCLEIAPNNSAMSEITPYAPAVRTGWRPSC